MSNWYGWFIQQSLDDQEIFNMVPTIKMKSEEVDWMEHVVEISGGKLGEITDFLVKHLKPGWYAHMIKGNQIRVVFKDKFFDAKEGESYGEIETYGVDYGVPKEQMEVSGLFKLAKETIK